MHVQNLNTISEAFGKVLSECSWYFKCALPRHMFQELRILASVSLWTVAVWGLTFRDPSQRNGALGCAWIPWGGVGSISTFCILSSREVRSVEIRTQKQRGLWRVLCSPIMAVGWALAAAGGQSFLRSACWDHVLSPTRDSATSVILCNLQSTVEPAAIHPKSWTARFQGFPIPP